MWLIVLPGEGFASAQAQSPEDPYLAQQLVAQGTLLRSYSPLQAGALSADAALLSGQSTPQESVYTAPVCGAPAQTGTTAQPSCTPGSAAELASVDAYLHQLIPQITAGSDYREHGLIAIAFSDSGASPAGPSSATPSSTTPAPAANPTPTVAPHRPPSP